MKRVVIVFGLISGVISSILMFTSLSLMENGTIDHKNGEVIGYTAIFLSFLLVFFGIRRYREINGGSITFGRAVMVGLLITMISCALYVVTWEIIYFNFMPDYLEKWAARAVDELREKGASAEAIAAKQKEMAELQAWYSNPLLNAAFTFLEPFPVGLLVTLVSSAILRRRESAAEVDGAVGVV
jgi:hypothetical protein